MLKFIGKFLKYLLWIIFLFIILFLFIWLTKFKFNLGTYINFLNDRDRIPVRNQVTLSNPSSIWYIFRGSWNMLQLSWDIADSLSWESLSWEELNWQTTGLDVYDPSFQEGFDTTADTDLQALLSWDQSNETWFWFQGWDTPDSTTPNNTGKSVNFEDLKDLVNQKEMNN